MLLVILLVPILLIVRFVVTVFGCWPLTLVEPPGGWLGPVARRMAALNFCLSPANNLHSDEM